MSSPNVSDLARKLHKKRTFGSELTNLLKKAAITDLDSQSNLFNLHPEKRKRSFADAELESEQSNGANKRRCIEQPSLLSEIKNHGNGKSVIDFNWERFEHKTDGTVIFNNIVDDNGHDDNNNYMTSNWLMPTSSCQDVVMAVHDINNKNGDNQIFRDNSNDKNTITNNKNNNTYFANSHSIANLNVLWDACFNETKYDDLMYGNTKKTSLFLEQPHGVDKWDRNDLFDELACVPYLHDIMTRLKETEGKYVHSLHPDYMSWQQEINNRMRIILLDWLIDVHRKFKLSHATLHLCVNVLDRFLGVSQVQKKNFQLVGCACLWLASKYHEIQCPEINDFLFVSDNAFTERELVVQESKIVEGLKFQLTVPTPLAFAQRFLKIGSYEASNLPKQSILESLVLYLLEHCLMNYQLSRDLPSKIAAACLAYSFCFARPHNIWPKYLEQETRYNVKDLYSTMKTIDTIMKADKQKCKHKAVRKKYASSHFHEVSSFDFSKVNVDSVLCWTE